MLSRQVSGQANYRRIRFACKPQWYALLPDVLAQRVYRKINVARSLASLALLLALVVSVNAQTIQINRENKTIAINTSDEAAAVADIAAISVGFEIYEPDSASAATEAGKLSHAIMDHCTKPESKKKASRARINLLAAIPISTRKKTPRSARNGNFASNNPGRSAQRHGTRVQSFA